MTGKKIGEELRALGRDGGQGDRSEPDPLPRPSDEPPIPDAEDLPGTPRPAPRSE